MPHAIGSLFSLVVLSLLAAVVGVTSASEARTSRPVLSVRADHMVLDLVIYRDQLLVGTQSGRVDIYDRATGQLRPPLFVESASSDSGFAPTIRSLDVSPNGTELAVATADGLLRRFELAEKSQAGEAVLVDERAIPGLMLARYLDDRLILLADMRGELALFDIDRATEIHRHQLDYDPIYAIELSPDHGLLAVAFRSSRVQIVEPETGEVRHVLKGHLDSVFGVAWLSDHELATAGKDKRVLVWDLREPDPRPRVLYRGDHFITALGIDRIAGRVALSLDGFDVGLVQLSDQKIERRLSGHTAPIQKLLFIDEGRGLVSAGHDARVFVWNLEHQSE
jgi:WD40 repeat protein